VQSGPHGQELIVDETFASLLPAQGIATGCVWDAIAAPVLALPPAQRRRFLLLGLGGGSAARIVRALAPEAEIVAVELDAEVVRVARRHFGLDALELELIVDDALAVLRRERRRFDAVLEDVFVGHGDDVHKPDWIPHPGLDLAAQRVRAGGLLVSNTLDETRQVARALAGHFPRTLCIDVDEYDNRVLVAGPESLQARALRAAIAREPSLRASLQVLRLRRFR
jgi:spermidine synthase